MWNKHLLALIAVAACVSAVDEGFAPLKELGEAEVDTAKTQATAKAGTGGFFSALMTSG